MRHKSLFYILLLLAVPFSYVWAQQGNLNTGDEAWMIVATGLFFLSECKPRCDMPFLRKSQTALDPDYFHRRHCRIYRRGRPDYHLYYQNSHGRFKS